MYNIKKRLCGKMIMKNNIITAKFYKGNTVNWQLILRIGKNIIDNLGFYTDIPYNYATNSYEKYGKIIVSDLEKYKKNKIQLFLEKDNSKEQIYGYNLHRDSQLFFKTSFVLSHYMPNENEIPPHCIDYQKHGNGIIITL